MKALGGSIERSKQALGCGLFGLLGLILGLSAWNAQAQLNDTGVYRYGNGDSFTPTEPFDYPGQDPSYGRDAAAAAGVLPKVGGGARGFDFIKLDSKGNPLPASAESWVCVRDKVTNLDWEVKTNDGGLRYKDWRYSWYDAQDFAAAVNEVGLCGHVDWRLPTREELRSIVDYGIAGPGAYH